eukprot:s84_g19.t1
MAVCGQGWSALNGFTTAGTPCPKGATRGRCKSCTEDGAKRSWLLRPRPSKPRRRRPRPPPPRPRRRTPALQFTRYDLLGRAHSPPCVTTAVGLLW